MHYLCLSAFVILSITCITEISSTSYSCNRNSTCGCSTNQTTVTARIIGGEAAANHAWGWTVSLRRYGSHICGASLLTDTFAITAAHCVDGYENSPSLFSILAGSNYLYGSGGQTRTISTIYMHPSYNDKTYDYDIALVGFSALSSSSNIAYICLPEENEDPFVVNDNLVAVGWGVVTSGSNTASSTLLQVTLPVVASTAQACVIGGISNTNVQFCAGVTAGGKDTCQGDSGGPLMAFKNNRWVLAGLTSSGVQCALVGYAGVYTRVSYFIPYIYSILDSLVSQTSTTTTQTTVLTTSKAGSLSYNQGNKMRQSILATIFAWILFLVFQ